MTKLTLLDGGMGQELVKRSGQDPTPLWSTQVMIDHPGLVRDVHLDYFRAGATIATTNTYAIHHDRFDGTGLEHRFADLNAAALSEAQEARKAFGRGRIAGSIGPLAASYRADIHPVAELATPLYAEKIDMLGADVDLVLFETVVSRDAAHACISAGRGTDLPVWLALTVDDRDGTRLRSGEALADLRQDIDGDVDAVLINCSVPEAIPAALDILQGFGVPFGAYANGFTHISSGFLQDKPTVAALTARGDLTPQKYAEHVLGWVSQGATIVGGCCETGPAHIAEIARVLQAEGHQIV